ncbi:hypothetical protein OHB24_17175 [Kribbella sp. NBC_00482]|uniref:hypothetical protein n=1 Tax=Kribbella sp. NBC_00482 TaxID=2975968 RepID=UPI002E16FB7C
MSDAFLVRPRFMHQVLPATVGGDWSDRKLPPREDRPSATRIMSSRGAALRFYLTAIAEAQIRVGPGKKVDNPIPIRHDKEDIVSWVDLIASSTAARSGSVLDIHARDKKQRMIHTALNTLEKAELVQMLKPVGARNRYDGFVLLNEIGARRKADPLQYAVPTAADNPATLPVELVTAGWLHLLEDSELATLLMVACNTGTVANDGSCAIPGDVRIRHYGLGRDAFEAHRMLRWLGLAEVQSFGRWDDGSHVNDYGNEEATLYRIKLRAEGFQTDPAEKLRQALETQLGRPPRTRSDDPSQNSDDGGAATAPAADKPSAV